MTKIRSPKPNPKLVSGYGTPGRFDAARELAMVMKVQERNRKEPLLFLDFDDVINLERPYGGLHLLLRPQPHDIHLRLWHRPALEALLAVLYEVRPQIVLTTSWLRFLDVKTAKQLFERTGAHLLGELLHPEGEAPQQLGWTRLQCIEEWLTRNRWTGPYVVLDDTLSGTGLQGSVADAEGRVIMCKPGEGFLAAYVPRAVRALRTPR